MMLPLLLVTSCAVASSKSECPAIVIYSGDEQAQVALDLDLLPPDSPVKDFIRDYGVLRDEVRACQHVE
jgi:hypothetical protein